MKVIFNIFLRHDGVVVSTVVSQQVDLGFKSRLQPFCGEFPCCISLDMCGFSPGTPVPSHSPKTCFLGDLISLSECECECLFLRVSPDRLWTYSGCIPPSAP